MTLKSIDNTEDIFTNFDIELMTSNDEIKNEEDYIKIKKICLRMLRQGIIHMGTGYCLSMSEMILVALKQQGIGARLVECSLTIFRESDSEPYDFIGFSQIHGSMEGTIDTHVVVVTETTIPYLIDASIAHRLPKNKPILLDQAIAPPGFLGDYSYPHNKMKISYQQKYNQKIGWMHQESIIDRINTDRKIFDQIKTLKKLNYIGIGLSLFAVISVVNQIFKWFIL